MDGLSMNLIFLILGLLLAGFSVYLIVRTVLKTDDQTSSLAMASGDEPQTSKSPLINFSRPLVHSFAMQHTKKIKSEEYRKRVKTKLITAGLASELSVDEFIGLQIFWGIFFPIIMMALNFALDLGLPGYSVIFIAGFGAMFPHLYANSEKKKRNLSVQLDLPFFTDLLALSTEAGLDFFGAIQRIADKAKGSVLGMELQIVIRDTNLGSSRADALRGLSERLDMSEITSFVAVILDADQSGVSIAKVLKDQSIQMRLERFVRAEKAGAQASQALLIPIMLFIVPAVFIMVLAPVALSFSTGG
jgi:tight adherence protein C